MDRRRFLALSAATAALPRLRGFAQTPAASLTLHPDRPGPRVPGNFLGLSYETQQLSQPEFFSAATTGLIAQFRALAPHGVLRLGGNTSDYAYWKPTPASLPPPRPQRAYVVGDPPPDLSYGVTPLAVHNLKTFLDATGWTCVYGINLGTNTPALAADEAAFVARTLGDRLEYFQVGNEADRFATTIRDPKLTGHPWNANAYLDEWIPFAKAIVERVPGAKFGLPDVAGNAAWITAVGDRLADNPLRAHVACVSHHYYVGGPPSNPEMTVGFILHTDPRVAKDAGIVRAAAAKLGTAYRMTEGNTCYRGGKPGVSDVFASALWSADYLLQLANDGYAGVNLHGGEAQWVANSLGGKLPGDELVAADHGKLGDQPRPYYTPIAHMGSQFVAEPVNYGMRFAGHFAGGAMVPVEFDPGPVNATAYAATFPDGTTVLAVINKDAVQDLGLSVPRLQLVDTLSAPSLTSREARLGHEANGVSATRVPRSTAALFHVR